MSVTLNINGATASIMPVAANVSQRFVYANGERTSEPVLRNGRPVYGFEAAIALGGSPLGVGRVETTTAELPEVGFGELLQGKGSAELTIAPRDQFSLRLTLAVDEVVMAAHRNGGE